jgi:polyhydroxyalkanoate synthesis regulator phasin
MERFEQINKALTDTNPLFALKELNITQDEAKAFIDNYRNEKEEAAKDLTAMQEQKASIERMIKEASDHSDIILAGEKVASLNASLVIVNNRLKQAEDVLNNDLNTNVVSLAALQLAAVKLAEKEQTKLKAKFKELRALRLRVAVLHLKAGNPNLSSEFYINKFSQEDLISGNEILTEANSLSL